MAPHSFFLITLISNLCAFTFAQTQHFFSIPSIAPPTLVIDTYNADLAIEAPVFFTPFQTSQPGPLIFDSNGTLIWDGAAVVTGFTAHDLTVCNFKGSPHLCLVDGTQFNGFLRGTGRILDNTYTEVKSVRAGNNQPDLDQHEFKVINGGTSVLTTIYKQVSFNGSKFGIPDVSFVTTGIVQEIDIESGNVLFEWSSIDHVPVNQSLVLPGTTDISGDGKTSDSSWDYFHINSVDKTDTGDFIVSARHSKAIYKISGLTGSILWQLGGKSPSITSDYEFNFQHDARVRATTDKTLTLSLYDNGADDSPPPPGTDRPGYEPTSSGLVVIIDESAQTSRLLERYNWPNQTLSTSQGDMQFLPNDNKLLGAGSQPKIAEFTTNATGNAELVFSAHLSYDGSGSAASYRDFKFPWRAFPATLPDLFTYAHNCSTSPVMYASWNGATEVAMWRFSTSNTTDNGTFQQVGRCVQKSGFETMAVFGEEGFAKWTIVEALDVDEGVLGRSIPVRTFVPGKDVHGCGGLSCGTGVNYTTADSVSCGGLRR